MKFCLYDDVLGVGYMCGFMSLFILGVGELNFDMFVVNSYETKG